MRIRVTHEHALEDLQIHLNHQGFRATAPPDGPPRTLEVLFPAAPQAFAAAAELDLWCAENAGVSVSVIHPGECP